VKQGAGSLFSKFITVFAVVFILYHLVYISDVLLYLFAIALPYSELLGVHLGGLLFLSFLLLPARKDKPRAVPPWYDIILALVSLVPTTYYIAFVGTRVIGVFLDPTNIAMGWILLILLLEASRRAVNWIFTAVMGFFVLYPLFANVFPGFLHSKAFSFGRVGESMLAAPHAIFGIPLGVSARIIIIFLLFAALLFISGAGAHFTNLALSLVGRMRGGAAKAAVVASGLFGSISGSPSANIATTGTLTIPLMKRTGYPAHYAGAVEAAASTGGIFTPPVMGAVAFIMAEFIGMRYGDMIIRLFFPAWLYFATILLMVHFQASKLKLKGIPREELPSFKMTVRQGYWIVFPFALLLYLLIGLHLSPEKSALGAIVSLVVLAALRRESRIGPRRWVQASDNAVRQLLAPGVACATVGISIGTVYLTGLGGRLSHELVLLAGNSLLLLLVLAALTAFILGMGLSATAVYVLMAILVAPAIVRMGVDYLPAHLFVFYWGMLSFLTPPVAIGAFIAAGLARAPPFKTGITSTRLAIVAYILPFAFVFRPAILLQGSAMDVLLALVATSLAIVGFACGFERYLFTRATWLQSVMFIAGAVLLLVPEWRLNLAGFGSVGGTVAWQWMSLRRTPKVPNGASGIGLIKPSDY
jgi:TRAP transporter 4TM/12TM fusion protein